MSAKPKPVDPYAEMDGPVVSRQLLDDVMSPDPSAEARAWLARSLTSAEDGEARSAETVMQEMRALIDRIEKQRGG